MPPPIYINRPTALKTLSNKWSSTADLAPFLNALSPSTSKAVKRLDMERANIGRPPLTGPQTKIAATAAETDKPVTPEKDENFLVDAARDIQAITSTIPKLIIPHPNNPLVKEATALTNFLPEYAKTMEQGGNPLEQVGNLAQLPGVRMLPGAFVASQFGTGGQGVGGLTEHPVFTALDVLPYANKAARATGTVKRATALAEEASKATETLPRPTRPFSTLATRWSPGELKTVQEPLFGRSGPLVERVAPNPVGRALQEVSRRVQSSRGGNIGSQAFGAGARELARLHNRATEDITVSSLKDSPHIATAKQMFDDEMAQFAERYQALEEPRRIAIYKAVEADDIGNLAADEQVLANEYLDISRAFRDKVERPEGIVNDVPYAWGDETYDAKTAANLLERRFRDESQQAGAHLVDQLDPRTATRAASQDEIWADVGKAAFDDRLSAGARQKVVRGYLRALKGLGVEGMDGLIKEVTNARGTDVPGIIAGALPDAQTFYRTADDFIPASERIAAAIDPLKAYARTDPNIADVVRSLERNDWARANDRIATLQKRTKFVPNVDLQALRDAVRLNRDSVSDIDSLANAGFTRKAAKKAAEKLAKAERRAVPARMDELVRQQADELITTRIRNQENLTPEQVDEALNLAYSRSYPELEQMVPDIMKDKKAARDSWMELAARGDNPQFVHHVSEAKAAQMSNPKVFDYPTTISGAKKRLWDAGPAVQDLSVALNHQALEYLVRKGSDQFVLDAMGRFDDAGQFQPGLFGRSMMDVRAQYAPLARTPDGLLDEARLAELIEKDYSVFDPESFVNPRAKRPGADPTRTILAPKEIVANLDRIKPTVKDLVPVIDPVMRVFRTSVLPLSPRWHINNILSGLILMPLRSGNPFTVWKNMAKAFNAVRKGEKFEGAPSLTRAAQETASGRLAPPGGMTRQAGEWFRDIDTRTSRGKLSFLHNYAAGRTLGRIFNETVQKSYNFNQAFDDFYRNMSYFEGLERGLKKGASYDDAVRAGIIQSRKILQNWDTLTPLERTTMRMLFPFYSWSRHVLKYVMSYPADHPWRTSTIAKLAATEQADFDTGLPQRMMSLFFLGPTDADGNVSAINLDGMNPFRDVANYATLGGFLSTGEGDISAITSQFNPMISTVMRWTGMDPTKGQPELYPDLTIDPLTGGMKAKSGDNPLITAATSFIPQTRLLASLTGASQEFKELARSNPDAAGRYLASSMGLPVLKRDVDIPREQILAELKRYDDFRNTITDTFKAGGDVTERYPSLGGFKEKLRALDPKILERYRPQPGLPSAEQPGVAELFAGAFNQR